MEPKGVVGFRHRRSPSSDRFLDVFSPVKSDADRASPVNHAGDEISEDEVFWKGDFAEPKRRSCSASAGAVRDTNRQRQFFRQPENFGILAALYEDDWKENRPVVCRKPSILSSPMASSSRVIPAIPKPAQKFKEREYSQSMPSRNFHQSAPMNVPAIPQKVTKSDLVEVDLEDAEDDEMLPPHEIVARGSAASPKTTFSVLEGVGRTLKGRDLRQVRNAVWRQTGKIVYLLKDSLSGISTRSTHTQFIYLQSLIPVSNLDAPISMQPRRGANLSMTGYDLEVGSGNYAPFQINKYLAYVECKADVENEEFAKSSNWNRQ